MVGPLFNGTMDILKYLAKPTNAYFPGADHGHHAGRVYLRLLLLRPPHAPVAGIVAKFTVALICNVILNTFCLSILLARDLAAASAQNSAQRDHVAHRFLIFFYLAKFMETAGVLRQFGLKPALKRGRKPAEALKADGLSSKVQKNGALRVAGPLSACYDATEQK